MNHTIYFNKSQTTLIQYPEAKAGSYTIPNSVTDIGGRAFSGCTSLTSATIGNSVTNIGGSAFYDCTSLANITIGNSVTSIWDSAFADCTSLNGAYFKGNAPSINLGFPFKGANMAIVYYLPGTVGWDTTYAGRPTLLWNPQVQTSDASFGVRTNGFGFTVTGNSDMIVVVDASTNLSDPVWLPLRTNTLTSGSFYFSDPQWTNYPSRFYRLQMP